MKRYALLLFTIPALAVPISPGQVYRGKTTLSANGISFILPKGFSGRVEGDGMIIGHDTMPGIIYASIASKLSSSEVKRHLGTPIDMGDGTTMVAQRVKQNGSRFTVHYKSETAKGYGVARRHKDGRAIIFVGSSTKMKRMTKALQRLSASVKFARPQNSGYWRKELANQKINSYSSRGGSNSSFTSSSTISLCADGTYNYHSSSSGYAYGSASEYGGDSDGSGASHAGSNSSSGRWRVSGPKARGLLVLTDESGSSTFQLSYNGRGHFLVDGSRWLFDSRSLDCP